MTQDDCYETCADVREILRRNGLWSAKSHVSPMWRRPQNTARAQMEMIQYYYPTMGPATQKRANKTMKILSEQHWIDG